MAKATAYDKYMAALLARGYRVVRTGKYTKMERQLPEGGVSTLQLGRRGAVRSGSNASQSLTLSDKAKGMLLAEGEAILTKK